MEKRFSPKLVQYLSHWLRGSNEDKSGTVLRPMMTKTSQEQDKTENLKTETRQKWDIGQEWDIIET